MKRQDDAAGEDHTEERHPPVDWKVVAPRWALIAAIGILTLAFGWTLGRLQSNNDERIETMARYQNDSRWDLLIRHGQQINDLQRAVNSHEARLEKLAAMAEDVRVLRRIAETEANRRRRSGGGYGLGGGTQ